jgi:KaiC domain protein
MSASIESKVPSGIAGLDEMLRGGFPSGHVVLVLGPPGVGKTCFGLQFLMGGLAREEKGIYLSLEEDVSALEATARQFSWPLEDGVRRGKIKIVRLDPRQANTSMKRIMGELPREFEEFKPKRMVIDSVSLLSLLAESDAQRREVLFDLASACRKCGATTIFTGEADPNHPETSRDGLSEYVADGVVLLNYQDEADRRRVGLVMRVVKMRRTAHARTRQPYVISSRGIEVDAKAVDLGRV